MSRPAPRPPLYGDRSRWALVQADCLSLLAQLPSSSVDAVVTDPPYGVAMATWDAGRLADARGFQDFTECWASEVRRVLRPGGYLASFGASRTMHRAVCGIEAAGLEVRDTLAWLYGSGMPKSRRMPGDLGTALRPMYEPIALARRPLERGATVAGNLAAHGTGTLNIGACRIPRGSGQESQEGYWPGNLVISHEPDCAPERGECTPTCACPMIDRAAAPERSPSALPLSRMCFVSKTSSAEREAGLVGLPTSTRPIFQGRPVRPRRNTHPTVKPIDLMRWIVRLVAPPGGLVLDPFAGSGSSLIAAVLEGRQAVGIEREVEYVDITRARLAHWTQQATVESGS